MANKDIFEKSAKDRAFWLSNGQKIDSIKELSDIIGGMDEGVFTHHVNAEKNDFAAWIKDVFNEGKLADNIGKLTAKDKIKSAITHWVSEDEVIFVKPKKTINPTFHKKAVPSGKDKEPEKKEGVIKSIIEEDLKGVHDSRRLLAGVVDFVLGFMVGVLSMTLFLNMV